MKIFRLLIISCCSLLLLNSFAFAKEPKIETLDFFKYEKVNLKDAVTRGLVANPTIVAARAYYSAMNEQQKSTFSDFFPKADAQFGTAYSKEKSPMYDSNLYWNTSIVVSQPIFTGLALLSTHQKANLMKDIARIQIKNAELQLIGAIQSTFFSVLMAEMDVESKETSVKRFQAQLKTTKAFVQVGISPRVEVLDSEVTLAEAEQLLLVSKNNLATSRVQLNSLLNLPLTLNVDYDGKLEYTPIKLLFDNCLAVAYQSRPDIQIGEKSLGVAKKTILGAASKYYPTLSANYSYVNSDADFPGSSTNNNLPSQENQSVAINAEWNFFSSGSDFFAHRSALYDYDKVAAELNNTILNAGLEVKQAHLSLYAAADRISVAKKTVAAAEEAYRMQVARYKAQVSTNNDVIDALDRLNTSESNHITALGDYGKTLSALYVAMGRKNISLEIK